MPTQPYEPLLNRNMGELLKPVKEALSPVLKEAINYATHFYQRIQTSRECENDETFPIIALYLHIIQMTDSVEVLISNGCAEPANLLLRSSFEAKLAIDYMLEKNTKQRAISWMTKNIIDLIEELEKINPSDSNWQELKTVVEQTGLGTIPDSKGIPNLSDQILKHKNDLKKPDYAEAYTEYLALIKKDKRRKHPEWYSFFDGPKNLKELASYLNQSEVYLTLYSSWSRISHASDARHLTLPLEDGTSILGPIRNPLNSIIIGTTALSTLLEITKSLTEKYRSYESSKFFKWYKKEIYQQHVILVGSELNQLKWFEEKFIQKK
jgi:hypothetical protein